MMIVYWSTNPPEETQVSFLNLGIVEGKFLERGQYINEETGEMFKQSDFSNGKVVKINGYEYEILTTDHFSEKW